jgi:ELWxxDGT repeat protein
LEQLEDRRVLANNVPVAGAFAAELVRDINTSPLSSQTYNLTQVNGAMYFTASTLASGNELWRTDGTAAGTRLVKDILAGPAGSDPSYLTNIGGTLYFFADDGVHGLELWRSDGTAAGTTLVKDIIAGKTGSVDPIGRAENVKLTNVNGTIFFRVDRGYPNSELWKSDGTAAGTVLVKNVDVSHRFSEGLQDDNLRNVNGTLFFSGRDGSHGFELWRSDGTPAGTVMVKDIRAGAEGSTPRQLRNVNGTLFFIANDGSRGEELWRSDGTAAGTKIVKDLRAGAASSGPGNLINVQGTLFFTGDDGAKGNELWQSDGTAAGTKLVKDVRPGSSGSEVSHLTFANGELYFTANDGSHGQELWRSDGTPAGTALVKDIQTGSLGSRPNYLINVNGKLFFGADDNSGRKLWRSDGTAAGTVLVKDVAPAFSRAIPDSTAYLGGINLGFVNLNGKLLFSASDSSHGFELWRSDGTSGGTALVKDIREGTASSRPLELTNVGGTLFFEASDDKQTFGPSYKLWRSDGTAAGTVLVADRPLQPAEDPDGQPQYMEDLVFLANAGGRLFFDAPASGNNFGLWTSDGTAAGTLLLSDVVIAHASYASYDLGYLVQGRAAVDGKLFFTAREDSLDPGRHGFELWISDGTVEGTTLVKDIWPGRYSAYPTNLTNTSGVVFFAADDGVHGDELWRSDGTEAGTTLVKDIHPGAGGTIFSSFVNINGILYFSADGVGKGKEVWRSDGTAEGTFRITDLNPSLADSSPGNLTNVGGTLFFTATDGASGVELWRSDGTAAGTSRVKDIKPGSASSSPADLTNVNGWLYFTATDGMHGRELWRSDGTAANTELVKDLRPGAADGNLVSLTSFHGRLMFQGDDGVHGDKLWESNGTAAGTRIVAGSAKAVIADAPSLEVMGDALYFAAPFADGGAELFRYGPQADTHTIYQGDPVSGTLSGFDPDGDTLTFTITSGPSHGQITSFNSSTGAYTYKPFRDYAGADSFTYQASDGVANSNEVTVNIAILANHAPVLDVGVSAPLDGIKEDATSNPGTPIWKLLAGVSDADAGAQRGLAVTYASNSANGTWQYTLNGGQTWVNLGAVSRTAARLIPADGANSRVRFVPAANFNGSVRIGYYAWDQTRGSAGNAVDVSTDNLRGDPTAFSESFRASSLAIAPVNDRPVIGLSGSIGYVQDKPAITLAAFATVSDVDSVNFSGGRLVVHIGYGVSIDNRLAVGGGFSVDAGNNVLQGTTIIGKRTSSGFGTSDLIVEFNSRVTPTVARDLVRAITFKAVASSDPFQRKVWFTLSDGDGGVSNSALKTVNVT